MPPKGTRGRKPKNEVQESFEVIKRDAEADQSSFDIKTQEAESARQNEVKKIVESVTVEGIVKSIGDLGLEVSRTLSGLSSQLLSQTELLKSLNEAVELEKTDLARLHKIDIAATSIDFLVQDYSQKKKDLQEEISFARSQWEEEQKRKEKELKDFEENLKKNRTREQEQYAYETALERKKDADQYLEKTTSQERKNKEKQEALEKSWAAREQALNAQEEELADLRKEVAEFGKRLEQETTKAVKEALHSAEVKFKQEILVLQKDREAEKGLAALKVSSLEDTATRQFTQIESLQERLELAKQQVQDIAIKAIEGASGARALSHVNQIAMEQAKPRTPQV